MPTTAGRSARFVVILALVVLGVLILLAQVGGGDEARSPSP